MTIDLREFGKRIRAVRGEQTGIEFGKLLGVKNNSISAYESGQAWPKAHVLDKIISISGKSADWLLYGNDLNSVRYPEPQPNGGLAGENEKGETWNGLTPEKKNIMDEISAMPQEEAEDLKALLRLKRRLGLQLTLSLIQHDNPGYPNKQSLE